MEEALTATPQEGEQERRRRTSPLFWLVWAVLIFCTLFWCGQLATRGSTGARPEGGVSGLSADYRPWPGLLFGPVGPGFIEDLQKALGAIAPPSGSGDCLLGAVCQPVPSDTPTATRTPVPTNTPTVTRTPTRTPVPSWTPTRTRKPPTATPLPSCSMVSATGLSLSGSELRMTLTNLNSGAMHLASSTVSWSNAPGQALTRLEFQTGPYWTGSNNSGTSVVSPASPPPLPSGGDTTWVATFSNSNFDGSYSVSLNLGFSCSVSSTLNVTPTPVPPTATPVPTDTPTPTITHTPTDTPTVTPVPPPTATDTPPTP